LTPFEDSFKGAFEALSDYYNPAKEKVRQAVNKWIRESHAFDAVVDLRRAGAGPQAPAAHPGPASIAATTCTRTTPATRRWRESIDLGLPRRRALPLNLAAETSFPSP
jgi:hypothetical protein